MASTDAKPGNAQGAVPPPVPATANQSAIEKPPEPVSKPKAEPNPVLENKVIILTVKIWWFIFIALSAINVIFIIAAFASPWTE
jgi:hypothetical protein